MAGAEGVDSGRGLEVRREQQSMGARGVSVKGMAGSFSVLQ